MFLKIKLKQSVCLSCEGPQFDHLSVSWIHLILWRVNEVSVDEISRGQCKQLSAFNVLIKWSKSNNTGKKGIFVV